MSTEARKAYSRRYYAEHREAVMAKNKQYADKHKAETAARAKRWAQEHPDRRKQYQREWRSRHPEKAATWWRIRKYGVTPAIFEAMFSFQGGACAACQSLAWGPFGPEVHHIHSTGEVRGLLCHACNTAAGMLHDGSGRAKMLAAYLER